MHLTRVPRSLFLTCEPAWFPVRSPRARRIPVWVRDWLAERGSLTARLQAVAGPIRVEVLRQDWGKPFPSEAIKLQLPQGELVWTREVLLEGQGRQLLLARTVAPAATMTGPGEEFARLGNRPLGELLFCRADVKRIGVEWACPDPACWLTLPQRPHWGRRALYQIGGLPLLVSEFFLPAVFALEGHNEPA